MFLHENDLYMGVGWVGLLFFHLKNKKRDVEGGGGVLGKICFVMGY